MPDIQKTSNQNYAPIIAVIGGIFTVLGASSFDAFADVSLMQIIGTPLLIIGLILLGLAWSVWANENVNKL